MNERHIVWFCSACALQSPAKGTTNDCCKANAKRVFADTIRQTDDGVWHFEEWRKGKSMGRQMRIKGTERKRNPKLAAAMEKYVDLRDKSIQAGNRASVAKEELLELAVKNKDELVQVDDEFVFIDDESGYELIFTDKANVKVRRHKDEQAADVGDG